MATLGLQTLQQAKGVKKEILDRVARALNQPFCQTTIEVGAILMSPVPQNLDDPDVRIAYDLQRQALAPVVASRTVQGRVFRTKVTSTGTISTTNQRGLNLPPVPTSNQGSVSEAREALLNRNADPGGLPVEDNFITAFGYDRLTATTGINETKFVAEIQGDVFTQATREDYPAQTFRKPEDLASGNIVRDYSAPKGVYDDPVVKARQDLLNFFRLNDPQLILNGRLRGILLGLESYLDTTTQFSFAAASIETNSSILFFESLIPSDQTLLAAIKSLPTEIREKLASAIIAEKLNPGDIRLMFKV